MTSDDVSGNEMDDTHDFDDETAESLLAGSGRSIDPELADLLGDVRVAFTSSAPAVGAELAALIGSPALVLTSARRFERMRSSMMAKIGVAAAAIVAATGGLAAAGALPNPVHAISHIGVDDDGQHHNRGPGGGVEDETSTTVEGETTMTVEDNDDNHGDDVSGEAHEHEGEGCEHGDDVSEVASDGRSHNPCETPTTIEGTPTTIEDHDGQHRGPGGGGDDGDDGDEVTPTTVGTTPTTIADNDGENRGPGGGGENETEDESHRGGGDS